MAAITRERPFLGDPVAVPAERVIWLSVDEYARMRRVSTKTIYRHLHADQIPGAERIGNATWQIPIAATVLVAPVIVPD